MSYRDDLNRYKEERNKIKKISVLVAKITVVVLAVAFLVTTVLVVVDIVSSPSSDGSGFDGGSSGGRDSTPPEIRIVSGLDEIYIYQGETVSWRNVVKATDNSGQCTLTFNADSVNVDKVGTYSVTYKATDSAGNSTEKTFTVVVTKKEYSLDEMKRLYKQKATELGITDSMSKKDKVRKIYNFVNDPSADSNSARIGYGSESLSARENWKVDWVEEAVIAINAINTNGRVEGDCYTYFAVSKAFFTVLNIDSRDIKRDTSLDEDYGTHFWLIVNIGDESNAQWYYYDATRLKYTFEDGTRDACLITLDKLQNYDSEDELGYDFYAFDSTDYPTASTTKVN